MTRPLMRDYLYHLVHVQAGRWAEPNCAVCNLSSTSLGIRKQSEVTPDKKQKTRRVWKRHHPIGCTCGTCFAKRIAELSK